MSTDAAKRAHEAVEAAVKAHRDDRGTDALTEALEALTAALNALAGDLEASPDLRLARVPAWYTRDAEAAVRDATHRHRLIAAGEPDPVAFDVARLPLRAARHAVIVAAEALDRAAEDDDSEPDGPAAWRQRFAEAEALDPDPDGRLQ